MDNIDNIQDIPQEPQDTPQEPQEINYQELYNKTIEEIGSLTEANTRQEKALKELEEVKATVEAKYNDFMLENDFKAFASELGLNNKITAFIKDRVQAKGSDEVKEDLSFIRQIIMSDRLHRTGYTPPVSENNKASNTTNSIGSFINKLKKVGK